MKKRALLIVGLALMVAAAGVVYAHWTDTLNSNADIGTGFINMSWAGLHTDDDTASGNVQIEPDTYDKWGVRSSDDPNAPWRCTSGICAYATGGTVTPRYSKDVALCEATLNGDALEIDLYEAYPSYYCTVFADVVNTGNVPVKATAFRMWVTKDGVGYGTVKATADDWSRPQADCDVDPTKCPSGVYWNNVHELQFDYADGTACGNQIDPGSDFDAEAIWFHVEQGIDNSTMSQSYHFTFEQDFVNWNEWDDSMCDIWVNDVLVYNAP